MYDGLSTKVIVEIGLLVELVVIFESACLLLPLAEYLGSFKSVHYLVWSS